MAKARERESKRKRESERSANNRPATAITRPLLAATAAATPQSENESWQAKYGSQLARNAIGS